MAATIFRPCYCTRESVMREMDVKVAQYYSAAIDRKIVAAAEDIEGLTQRRFYPEDKTVLFDWPNFQYAYPWELWLDQYELAATPTLVVTGALLASPVTIPTTDYILWPYTGPPYTQLQLRRDRNSSYGANSTPQQDIGITGTYGYWTKTAAVGTFAANVLIGDTTVTTSIGSGAAAGPGVGDLLICASERMIVQDSAFTSAPGITYSGGLTSNPPLASDNQITGIAGGTLFQDETILIDSEIMLVYAVTGTTAIVKRAFDGTVLATHGGNSISVKRSLTVLRGQLGTAAAAHSNGDALSIAIYPNLIKELAVAEAVNQIVQGQAAWATPEAVVTATSQTSLRTGGQQREPVPGAGLPGLRQRVERRYGRQVRSRVV